MKKIIEPSEVTKSQGALTLELIGKAQAGDIAARNRLVTMHMRLVADRAHAAARRCGKISLVEDLIQAAVAGATPNDGLIHAIEKFDLTRGFRFSTYAVRWIDNAIQNELTRTKVVRMGRTSHGESRLRAVIDELTHEDGCLPTPREVRARCVFLEMKPPSDQAIERALLTVYEEELPSESLNQAPSNKRNTRAPNGELRALTADANPFGELEDRELGRALLAALDALTPQERDVIAHSFELAGAEPLTQEQIATKLALSRQRVGQLKAQALEKLQQHLAAEHGESLGNTRELPSALAA
jgi:RNA polymerase primary sigma factor